jgi:hypothetical protein
MPKEGFMKAIKRKLDSGEAAIQILDECRRGMSIVGEGFKLANTGHDCCSWMSPPLESIPRCRARLVLGLH